MVAAIAPVGEIERRLRAVPPPRPVLARSRERKLTERQRGLLDQLSTAFDEGFADLTMAEVAARLNCSLRTLYALAPSRDELVLIVIDRNLWRIGRTARAAIAPGMAPLDAIRAYLHAATLTVSNTTEAFSRDLAAIPGGDRLAHGHNEYLFALTRTLLDLAVEQGDITSVDTAAVARVMAGLGRQLTQPDVIPTLRWPPKRAADTILEIILRGLQPTTPTTAGSAMTGHPTAP
jgi:AcrR family transcriptional regulator